MSKSIYRVFKETEAEYKKDPAVRFERKELSYEKLDERIVLTSGKLKGLGIKKGDTVAVNVPNCLEAVELFLAINRIGAIVYFIHPLTPGSQMKEFLSRADCKILFCLALKANEYRKALPDDVRIVSINPYDRVNLIKKIAVKKMAGSPLPNILDYSKLPSVSSEEESFGERAPAVYLNTGGTNGEPKIVMLSNEAIWYLGKQGINIIKRKDGRGIKIFTVIPLFHGYGLTMGVVTPLVIGGESVLMMKFQTKKAVKMFKKNQANTIIGVPALYNALLANKKFEGKACRNLIVGYVGGDSVTESLMKRFEDRVKESGGTAHLHQGYGLTETVTVCNVNTDTDYKLGSIGKPVNGVKNLILDVETRKVLGPNEEGEIAISGPTIMNGYFKDEELSEKCFTEIDGDRYLLSRDLGYIDGDGFLYFRARLRRIAKVNGVPVCPGDLEKISLENPNVYEAYCYPVADEKFGSLLNLILVKNKNSNISDGDLENEIRAEIARKLPVYCKPKNVLFMDALPRTAVGKVDASHFE